MEAKINKTLQKIDSLILSDYIVKHYGPISHLKLQKMLFYCDAYHMAYFNEELITDKFEAWMHGPVCRKVWNEFKDVAILNKELKYPEDSSKDKDIEDKYSMLTLDQQDFIKEVLDCFSSWTAQELEYATHTESPWMEARKGYNEGDKCEVEISKENTKTFYKKEMYGE